jgi:predicted metal-dependent hydrolase
MQLPDNYILVPKEVKHARIRVSEDGCVRIIIPPTFTDNDIEALIQKKQTWIDKNLKFFKKMSKIHLQRNQLLLFGNRYSYYYDSTYQQKIIINHEYKTIRAKRDLLDITTQEKWYKNIAKQHLTNRTQELSEKLNFKYNKLYIRNQRSKWGNCSKEKNISLNWRLVKAPEFVIDYIIIHELTHSAIMKHNHKFWTLLKSHYPQYQQAINWLDKYGNSL